MNLLKEVKTLRKETREALEWLASEFSFLKELDDYISKLYLKDNLAEEKKAYRKANKALRYVKRSEGKAERHISHLKKKIKEFPFLQAIGSKLDISEAQLVKAFSFYAGDFQDEMQKVVDTLDEKKKDLRQLKLATLFSKDKEEIDKLEKKVAGAGSDLKKVAKEMEEKIDVLIRWVESLGALLKQIKEEESKLDEIFAEKMTRRRAMELVGKGLIAAGLGIPSTSEAFTMVNKLSKWDKKRPKRTKTSFIILHTTEWAGPGSLYRIKRHGLANYMLDTDGTVYRTISSNKISKHAGRSMWNNVRNISNVSIGIEVVGYHNKDLTAAQYKALRELLSVLKKSYGVADKNVLTHSMVAYGAPNRWHKKSHRGRKRCAMLMGTVAVRKKLGLNSKPTFDPDVKAGRLVVADPPLEKILYGTQPKVIPKPKPEIKEPRGFEGFNVLKKGQSAFDIARDEAKSSTTIYFLTNGWVRTGTALVKEKLFTKLQPGTKILVGYVYGGFITAKRSVSRICGAQWNYPSTFYRYANGKIVSGDEVEATNIPKGTLVFFRN